MNKNKAPFSHSFYTLKEDSSCYDTQKLIDKRDILKEIRAELLKSSEMKNFFSYDKTYILSLISSLLEKALQVSSVHMTSFEKEEIKKMLLNDIIGLGPLEPLFEDPDITDILVNGPHHVIIEKDGLLQSCAVCFRDTDHLMHIAERIAHQIGRRLDESSPMLDARLDNGVRVNIIIPPLSLSGIHLSIRKFKTNYFNFDELVKKNTFNAPIAEILKLCIHLRFNIVISGGTGAGKTTLLNACSYHIDDHERIITIEDTAELKLTKTHLVRLEAKPANIENKGEITIRDLVKNALRMRPDRLIIGEVRSAEAIDMLQALNTGHDGSMSTIHANSPQDALLRLENMAYLGGLKTDPPILQSMINGAVDIIIHIERFSDGKRRLTHISEIYKDPYKDIDTRPIIRFDYYKDSQHHIHGKYIFIENDFLYSKAKKEGYEELYNQIKQKLTA